MKKKRVFLKIFFRVDNVNIMHYNTNDYNFNKERIFKMKTLKRIVIAVMALTLILGCFAGCANDTATGGETKDKLVMATNAAFPPYEFKDDSGAFAGIDVELAQKLAEKLGLELEIQDVEFGSIVGGVQSGKYDVGIAGMTVTDERLESVNFSDSYATGIQVVIVKEDSEYASYEDFYTGYTKNEDGEDVPAGVKEGIKIGVQQDTTGDIYSSSDAAEWGFGKDNVERYKTGADAVQALLTGKVTAVIIDNEPAKNFVAANEGLKILESEYILENYAIAINKDNKDLLDKVNAAISEFKADGTLDAIINKYIPAE